MTSYRIYDLDSLGRILSVGKKYFFESDDGAKDFAELLCSGGCRVEIWCGSAQVYGDDDRFARTGMPLPRIKPSLEQWTGERPW